MRAAMEKIAVVEALRGFAAIYVFAYHFVFLNFDRSRWWTWPFLFGHEAVMLFFLISGFAIMYSAEAARDKSFRSYFSRLFFASIRFFCLHWPSVTCLRIRTPTRSAGAFCLATYSCFKTLASGTRRSL